MLRKHVYEYNKIITKNKIKWQKKKKVGANTEN